MNFDNVVIKKEPAKGYPDEKPNLSSMEPMEEGEQPQSPHQPDQ